AAFLQQAPAHRWLHLATHGFFAAEDKKSALSYSPNELRAGRGRLGGRGGGGRGPRGGSGGGLAGGEPAGGRGPGRRPVAGLGGGGAGPARLRGGGAQRLRDRAGAGGGRRGGARVAARLPGGRRPHRGGEPVEGARPGHSGPDGAMLR